MKGLDAFIDARRAKPFVWGSQDCATLAGDWVLERTGRDLLADVRDRSLTVLQRLRVIHRAGGALAIGEQRLGPAKPGLYALRGDVVLVPSGHRGAHVAHKAFGLCAGSHLVAPGAHGLVILPLTDAEVAWRV